MNIDITGHQIQVTEAIRAHIHEKFARLERHWDHLLNIHVVLEVEKLVQKAEATIQLSGAAIFAEASEADLYSAIDALVDKLDRQIIKHKEKQQAH